MSSSSGSFDVWMNVGTAMAGVIAGMFAGVSYLHKKTLLWKREEERDAAITIEDIRRYGQVQEIITTLRCHANADRVQILQFHNGGKFLDGSPMKRISVTHESCKNGVAYEYRYMQAVLATLIWEKIELVKKDEPTIHLVRALADSTLKTYCKSTGTEAFAVLPIRKNNLVIGFIGMDWLDEELTPNRPLEFGEIFKENRALIELQLAKEDKNGG